MWDDKDLRTKARLYFEQAENLTDNDEYTLLWCALGIEFLLRAPLAAINPLLLADPVSGDGYSVLHAAGFAGTRDPVSIKTKTVIDRLLHTVDNFDTSIEQDVKFLVAIRNRELHTSWLGINDVSDSIWLPKFLRVVRVIAAYFNEEPDDYLSEEFLAHAERLTDAEDKRLKHVIAERIKTCASFAEKLTDEEKEARRKPNRFWMEPWSKKVSCPACHDPSSLLEGEPVRFGRETLDEDGDISRRVYIISQKFSCTVCGLELNSVPEIAAASLEQRWNSVISETIADRLGDAVYEPDYDYGND
jgi:hypothetical protein